MEVGKENSSCCTVLLNITWNSITFYSSLQKSESSRSSHVKSPEGNNYSFIFVVFSSFSCQLFFLFLGQKLEFEVSSFFEIIFFSNNYLHYRFPLIILLEILLFDDEKMLFAKKKLENEVSF